MTRIKMFATAAALATALPGQVLTSEIEGPRGTNLWTAPIVLATEASRGLIGEMGGEALAPGQLPSPAFQTSGGRSFALLRVASPGAAAYRFYFNDMGLPEGSRLFIYGLDQSGTPTSVFGPYEGSGPVADGEFRSKIITGTVAVIEVQGNPNPDWPFQLKHVIRFDGAGLAALKESQDPGLLESEAERRPVRGEMRPCLYRGKERTCEVIGETAYVEGDIVAGEAEAVVLNPGKAGTAGSRESVGTNNDDHRWPGGVIPYVVDDGLSRQVGQRRLMDSRVATAILYWNGILPGLLVPRNNDERDYVRFRRVDDGCSSSVGRVGRRQNINVADGCTAANLVHEIGHAIGLTHEHTREDRNDFVTIFWDNIEAGKEDNFWRDPDNTVDMGAYDFGSIMHYGRRAFGIVRDGVRSQTIRTIPAGIAIGQRDGLSDGDIAGAKKLLCHYRFNPFSLSIPLGGGEYDIDVTGPGYCDWFAAAPAWVNIVSGGTGTGNGRISISVGRTFLQRTGTITVGGGTQGISVQQRLF